MMVHPTRPDHEAILAEYRAGDTYETIGNRRGVSKQRIAQILTEHATREDRAARFALRKATKRKPLPPAERARRYREKHGKGPHPCPVCGELTTRKVYCSNRHARQARKETTTLYQARSVWAHRKTWGAPRAVWAEKFLRERGEL